MLKINQFYWQLYKESPEGKKVIEKFENAAKSDFSIMDSVALFKEFDPDWFLNEDKEVTKWLFDESLYIFKNWKFDDLKSLRKNAEDNLESSFKGDYDSALQFITPLSFLLYKKSPSYFIPYMFLLRYSYIRQIFEDYDIEIDEVPGKASIKNRCLYYLDICDALNKFKELNGLTGPELCAFIYDMERKQYDSSYDKENTPFPQVWLIGGKKQPEEADKKTMFWQANAETKKGDVLIFYETGKTYYKENKSCITGIWIAQTDGISDPMFHYYGQVIIGNEIKVKPIPFKVLFNDPRTNKLPRIGAHFLGISGDAVSTKQYEGLLSLIEEWDSSFDRSLLPKLYESYKVEVTLEEAKKKGLEPEKWVEEYFIRVLLEKKMNLKFKVDYDRQVYLQMGRAKIEKTQDGRTDFSVFIFGRKLKCADVLIEAKGPNQMDGRDLEKAFWQAESYASRQYASLIILADDKKVLLIPKSNDGTFKFSIKEENKYNWNDIFTNPDTLDGLRKKIFSYRKHGRK